MFLVTVSARLYFEPIGFAAAKIDVRALRVVIMPALAMETVCCSYKDVSGVELDIWKHMRERTHHDFV